MPKLQNQADPKWSSGRWAVASVLGLATVLILLAYIASQQPGDLGYKLRTEEGLFEQLTLILYALALVVCLVVAALKQWKRGIYPFIILLGMSMRELDFHIRFSPENMNSIRFWRSGEITLLHKLIAGAVEALIIVAVVIFVRGNFRNWLLHLKLGYPYAISIAGAISFVVVSYAIDNQLDMDALDKPMVLFLSLTEEAIELGIPILICSALIQWAISSGRPQRRCAGRSAPGAG
jgi:hypothetical protein